MKEDVEKISLKAFTYTFGEAQKCNRRFCFILGSGASREAGILTGVEMAKIWANELKDKYEEEEQKELMEKLEIESVEPTSKNYFDIYDLRFYPDYQEGYAYFERELERGVPSLGHHALAKILAGEMHNLAITTNFDSLIEDALFIYTNKHPLVVGHESLTEFINLNINRPIVAKIHRSLYFHPFNRKQETDELAKGWQDTLKNAFMVYTPVVIGYAGGDQSLMKFLKDESIKMNGLYWCYQSKEEPSEEIIDLVKSKNGCLVPIEGFDQMMFMLSRKLDFENPEDEIRRVTEERVERYNTQYDKFEKRIREGAEKDKHLDKAFSDIIKEMDIYNDEQFREADKEETAQSHMKKGRIYARKGEYEKAIKEYTKAIELKPDYVEAHNELGCAYDDIKEYEKAIEKYSKAIELKPDYEMAFYNRGNAYYHMRKYEKAIEDYTRAVELQPDYEIAFYNRGCVYANIEEYEKAIEDYTRAIELKPDYEKAFYNRGNVYADIEEYEKAIKDYTRAIELKPDDGNSYNNRADAYCQIKKYEKALEDCMIAIDLNPDFRIAYETRAEVYHALGEHEKAKQDEETAKRLAEKFF